MKLDLSRSPLSDLDLEVEVHHPLVTPDDPDLWMGALLGGPVVAADEMTTELGWPFVLVHGAVTGPDGAIVEHRIGAFYRFFHFVAALVVRAATADALSRRLPALTTVARGARPDLREPAVALSALWAAEPPANIR